MDIYSKSIIAIAVITAIAIIIIKYYTEYSLLTIYLYLVFFMVIKSNMLFNNEVYEKIKQLGGTITSSVTKNTSMVIVGDNPGMKVELARKLNIPMITEDKLLEIIGI